MLKSHQFALASLALVSWTVVSLACGGKVLEGGGDGGSSTSTDSDDSDSYYSTGVTDSYGSDSLYSSDTYGSDTYGSDTYSDTYDSDTYDTDTDSYYSESCWSSDDSYGCYGSGSYETDTESDSYYSDTSDSEESSDEDCVDFQLTPGDVACAHASDCSSVNTGVLCPGECLCGGTPANQAAAAQLQSLTASFPAVGCTCPFSGEPVCVSGRCQLVLPP